MSKKIAIIGSGDLGQLIGHHVLADKYANEVLFYDDFAEIGTLKGIGKIQGTIASLVSDFQAGIFQEVFLGVGYKHFAFRQRLYTELSSKIKFGVFVHSSSYMDVSVKLGSGTVILPGCTLDMGASCGGNVLLNTGCTIAHDTHIGEHSFLGPGVTMAGFINVGQCCFLGIGTIVIDNITITDGAQTGGGTVVTKNITEAGLYVGVPAKKIK